jgi:hypothetical protein
MESAMAIMESRKDYGRNSIPFDGILLVSPQTIASCLACSPVCVVTHGKKKLRSHVSLSGADHIPTLNAHRSGANIFSYRRRAPIKRSKTPFFASYPYCSDAPRPRGKFAYKAGVLHINSQLTMNAKKRKKKKCF